MNREKIFSILTYSISQLWEESQSENRRLRLENNALKLELQTTKTQLELAVQVVKKRKKKIAMDFAIGIVLITN